MSVTVITTTGNTYRVAKGRVWTSAILPTGELSVAVYDRNPDDLDSVELGTFGSVETAYRDSEVTVVQAPARSGL